MSFTNPDGPFQVGPYDPALPNLPTPGTVRPTRPRAPTAPSGSGQGNAGSGPAPTPDAPGTGQHGPAYATILAALTGFGLGSLSDWAWSQLVGGFDADTVMLNLRQQPEWAHRFKAILEREAAGLSPISEAEVIAYENNAMQMMREMGYPPGFYDDPEDFAMLIGANVSINELQQRLAAYSDLAAAGREQVLAEFSRFSGGDFAGSMTVGELAAWMIDPERALPIIRQRLQAAQISAGANQSGFGSLTLAQATRLTGVGVDEARARQAFAMLAQQGDVTGALAGEDPDSAMSRDDQIGIVAGHGPNETDLENRRRGRQGAFEGGGSFAMSGEGVGGLGSS